MEAERSNDNEPDERLCAVLLDFMESAERGVMSNRAALLAQHPELAPDIEEFLDTWVRVEHLTEPVRSASQVLQQANLSGLVPDTGGDAGDTALPATRVPGIIEEPAPAPIGRSRDPGQEYGGWLGRWLRAHPPLVAADYPFLAAQRPQEIGRLGHFRLFEVIGSGGMGVVFRGEDVSLQRPVAVKVLRAELAADPRFRDRFLREARSAASVDHEHVISVYHVGEESGIPFLGMQWLRGVSLEDLLRRAGQLSVPAVLRLGRQIALGLAAAHAQGLLHRDIKPANLWIELAAPGSVPLGAEEEAASRGRVKILDFGLVRAISDEGHLTVIGTTVGTPAYMAPEQATGASVDSRCDLFSLGVVLYRMCTGRLPFPARHQAAETGSLAVEAPVAVRQLNSEVPPGLADLIMNLLARDPASRPASAAGVAEQIHSLEAGQVAPASVEQPLMPEPLEIAVPRPPDKRSKRRWGLIVLAALVALVPLAYQFGGMVVRFATNQGEVVIAVDDPDTEVTVSEGGAVILDRKGQRRISLAAGEHELEVTVKDAASEIRFPFKKTVVLTRGGKEIVNISEALAESSQKQLHGTGDADRPEAKWVLAVGGKVKVSAVNRELEVRRVKDLPTEAFRLIGVDLSDTAVKDADLAGLGALAEIQYLRLSRTPIGDRGLTQLSGLKTLRTLLLDDTRVSDAGLEHLREFTRLENLSLGNAPVSDAGLEHFQPLKNLSYLSLWGTRMSDAGLAHLRSLTKLRVLILAYTHVTDAGLAQLRELTDLQDLDLRNSRVTNAGLTCLGTFQNLQTLNLNNTEVNDAGLPALASIRKLRVVSLAGTRVTDAGLVSLRDVKGLVGIDLADTRVTDSGLAQVGGLTGLRYLHLTRTQVTDAGIAQLAGLTGLQILNLGRTRVTDSGLAHLGGMKQLRELYLSDTRVTDAGLAHVLSVPPPPLAVLDLNGTRVSATGAIAVKGILPHAEIEWWEANRRAAEAILRAGGSVHVRTEVRENDAPIKDLGGLPADYFRLTRAGLQEVRKPARDILLLLTALADTEFDDLEEVDLSGTAVSDADLASLGELPCRRLVLDRAPVNGPGLVHLKSLPRLTDLRLGCPTLSFLGVRYAGELKGLERLSLAGSGTSDTSLKDLYKLVKLRELDLTGTKVTAEGIALLRMALPMCEIKAGPAGAR